MDINNSGHFKGDLTNCSITSGLGIDIATAGSSDADSNHYTCWDYWIDHYYPQVIHNSYPVYLQERAKDKGKQAFEVIKMLKDKKLIKLEKVSDFIDAMDALIKIL